MKALTLTQPWASLVVSGAKSYETRGWYTGFTGVLAISAAKTIDSDIWRSLVRGPTWPLFQAALAAAGVSDRWDDMPRGCLVGAVRMVQSVKAVSAAKHATPEELAFGDFGWGRWAFEFTQPLQFPTPIPCRGALNLWDLPLALEEQVRSIPAMDALLLATNRLAPAQAAFSLEDA